MTRTITTLLDQLHRMPSASRAGAYLALVSTLGLAVAAALQELGLTRGRRWAAQGLKWRWERWRDSHRARKRTRYDYFLTSCQILPHAVPLDFTVLR
jgi:hypothetical protein